MDYDDRGNLTNWNGAIYEYDDFNQMKRMLSGAEEWIYVYTAGDERVWLKRVGYGFARWTLRDLDAKVLREYTPRTPPAGVPARTTSTATANSWPPKHRPAASASTSTTWAPLA